MLLPNIIANAAEEAYSTLRRVGFVGGLLTRDIAGEVAERAYSDDNDTPYYYYCTNDDDGCYAISAQWDDMAHAPRHFGDDE